MSAHPSTVNVVVRGAEVPLDAVLTELTMSSTTAAPEQDGVRMKKLRGAFDKALSKVTSGTRWKEICSKFPEIVPQDEEQKQYLKDLFEQFQKNVEDSTRAEFDEILKENNVQDALNRLDQAIEAAKDSGQGERRRPKGAGDVGEAAASAIAEQHAAAKAALEEELAQVEKQNEELEKQLREQFGKLQEFGGQSSALNQLAEAVRACDQTLSGDALERFEQAMMRQ